MRDVLAPQQYTEPGSLVLIDSSDQLGLYSGNGFLLAAARSRDHIGKITIKFSTHWKMVGHVQMVLIQN